MADDNDRLNEEVRFHIEQQAAKNARDGMTPDQARRAALLKFGAVESFKEQARDQRPGAMLGDFFRDLRVSGRLVRRSPGFATVIVLTLALGIAASTTIFSVVEGVLLRPLPYPESDRIVRLFEVSSKNQRSNVSELNVIDWRTRTHVFEAIVETWATAPYLMAVTGGSEPENVPVTHVSREFFTVMRVAPAVGRRFADSEQHPGGTPAAIVSRSYWQHDLGGRPLPDVTLHIGAVAYAVVGVMPDGFDFPGGTAIWIPRELDPPETEPKTRTAHNFRAYARLAPGIDLARAQREMSDVSRALKQQYGDDEWMSDAAVVPLLDQMTATSKPTLELLFGASMLLLLVSATNVSNMLLARAASRRHEFALQMALGASRRRIVRQLLAETLALTGLGGAGGLLASAWAIRIVPALAGASAPRLDQLQIDWRVLGFAVAASVLTAVALALITAMGGTSRAPASMLTESTRTGSSGRSALFAREALVVAQVALTLVLLAGAALLAASLKQVLAVDPGFRVDDALVADVTAPWAEGEAARARQVAFQERLVEQVSALPGVTSVGLTNGFPLGGGRYPNGVFIEMTAPDEIKNFDDWDRIRKNFKDRVGEAQFRVVSDGYFRTLGIPVLRGRAFEAIDGADRPHVAVISRSLADAQWPNRDPIGRYLQFGNMDGDLHGLRVVGIVGDVRELQIESPGTPTIYVSSRQRPGTASVFSLVARGATAEAQGASVRRVIHDLNPEVPVELRTVRRAFDATLNGRRFVLMVIAVFAGSALILATLGLYGLMSFVVTQRTKEMGIRLALGATARNVIGVIVRRGLVLVLVGVAVGLVAARLTTGLMRDLVFGISPADPLVLAGVALLTLLATTLASYVPAVRASRIEPVTSLRAQ